MTGLLAHDALLVSFVVIFFGLIAVPVAVRTGRRDWMMLAYSAVYTNFLLVTVAVAAT